VEDEWKTRETAFAVGGVAALAVATYFAVQATENIVKAFGISRIVGGLFITTPVAALPEVFATWKVARSGQITSGVTSVMGDHAVTLTVALLPLALIGVCVPPGVGRRKEAGRLPAEECHHAAPTGKNLTDVRNFLTIRLRR
jgi:Ca2+/Na+ antiporter